MVYHQVKKVKGGAYHYLIHSIREGGAVKKFQIYLGRDMGKKELEEAVRKKGPELLRQADEYRRSKDPLAALLSREELEELDRIRKAYGREAERGELADLRSFEEDFITRFTYNSNAIEGSTLTLGEVSLILHDHVSPEGKELREVHEAENHYEAFEFVKGWKGDVTKGFLLEVHKRLMHNILHEHAGKLRDVQVFVRGSPVMPPAPFMVEGELDRLIGWYGKNRHRYHPVILAAYAHVGFEGIHPFIDGNGRTGRLLINFILRKNGYPLVDIEMKDRAEYMRAIEAGLRGELRPMVSLLLKGVRENRIVQLCAQENRL